MFRGEKLKTQLTNFSLGYLVALFCALVTRFLALQMFPMTRELLEGVVHEMAFSTSLGMISLR